MYAQIQAPIAEIRLRKLMRNVMWTIAQITYPRKPERWSFPMSSTAWPRPMVASDPLSR